MSVASQLAPDSVNDQLVIQRCKYFTTCQLWPLTSKMNAEAWLSNFTSTDHPYAAQLLSSVLVFRDVLINPMFASAFQALSRDVFHEAPTAAATVLRWLQFRDTVLVTYVTGEQPSPTDSGYTFARKARDVLGLPEDRILQPDQVLNSLVTGGPRPVLFVDDFVGSGDQFRETWEREVKLPNGTTSSFARVAATPGFGPFYYTPLLCTERGAAVIRGACPQVKLRAAHYLDERYSAFHPQSVVWPETLRAGAAAWLRAASLRAGISTLHVEGYASLGLTVVFEHGMPDASLPILRWNQNGWHPLFRPH